MTACQCEIPWTEEHHAQESIAEGAKNCVQCALSYYDQQQIKTKIMVDCTEQDEYHIIGL